MAKATLIGAASGAMTFGIGEAATAITQLAPKIAFQAVAHGMTQGVVSGIQGGNFWQGAASGALASIGASAWGGLGGNFARSGAGQITFGTISGGAGAALTGGNFWEGAATGFVVSALNHVAHKKPDPARLKKRIEKDGKLSLREANKWYRYGNGESLSMDASKVDLDFIDTSKWTIGQEKSEQLLFSSRDGRVYGNLTLVYKGNDQFRILNDTYNFEMHKGSSFKTWVRNQATKLGGLIAGQGVEYKIKFYGVNTVTPRIYVPEFPTGPKY